MLNKLHISKLQRYSIMNVYNVIIHYLNLKMFIYHINFINKQVKMELALFS